jgi:hypothetical protein
MRVCLKSDVAADWALIVATSALDLPKIPGLSQVHLNHLSLASLSSKTSTTRTISQFDHFIVNFRLQVLRRFPRMFPSRSFILKVLFLSHRSPLCPLHDQFSLLPSPFNRLKIESGNSVLHQS